ncbi:MAG: ornithine cyclodeaminase family protein [Alphaproteobacteria bacterium]|nr:MAG: ornithine cyclodeaminase family protein [Alphaproteobacteria bacterium]
MSQVPVLDAATLRRVLDMPGLIAALAEAFAAGAEVPLRHHHPVPVPERRPGMLLLMPAWQPGGLMGVKIVTVFPDNGQDGLASVQGSYLLMSAATGVPLAMMDGRMLTLRRTAAASALAASHLARPDAATLVMVGTGALIPHLIEAHRSIRPITRTLVWGRDPAKAAALAATVGAEVAVDLAAAVAEADIVSAATLSSDPLIQGVWLKPGAHVDLVGGFTPTMREADDEAIRRAAVFVDTRVGAMHEAGDITQPLANGTLAPSAVRAELAELVRGAPGRTAADQITLFKSVGTAIEDLAAAALAHRRHLG